MSELNDLKQDIQALNKEILSIEEQLQLIRNETSQAKKQVTVSNEVRDKNSEDILNNEYASVWAEFPELKNFILKQSDAVERTPLSPSKKGFASPRPHRRNLPPNIPEHEWVLKTQPDSSHKLFDPTIASFFDIDILRSPSKRNKLLSSPKAVAENQKMKELKKYIEVENCYRMSGITYFPVVDPSRLRLAREDVDESIVNELLGIRIDVFSESKHQYEAPYYVILKRDSKSSTRWLLFKYTIPHTIDIEKLWSSTCHGILSSDDEVYIFAKKCYIKLVDLHYRLDFIENLDRELFVDIKVDSHATLLSFKVITLDGDIGIILQLNEKCVIKSTIDIEKHDEWGKVLLGSLCNLPEKVHVLKESI